MKKIEHNTLVCISLRPVFSRHTGGLIHFMNEAIPGGKIVSGLGNARQGIGYGLYRYAGPKPPKGRQHLYRFTMYALDREINLTGIPTKSRFMKIAGKYMIQRGNIIGKYE